MTPISQNLLKYWRCTQGYLCPGCRRQFSRSANLQSGHSKWATIKHDKARNDASRGRQRAVYAKEIAEASKFGGDDPTFNSRLALAIATAKRNGFPKASIDTAIARGQGRSVSGAALETLTIEAVIPPVALMIDCQTDSKARALQDLRMMLKTHGASQTPTAYLFEKRGRITFQSKEGVGVDEVFDTALEAGALDVTVDESGRVVVDTEVETIKMAEKQIADELELHPDSSETIWYPNLNTRVAALESGPLQELFKLQEELEDYPGVQGVYMNFDIADANDQVERSIP